MVKRPFTLAVMVAALAGSGACAGDGMLPIQPVGQLFPGELVIAGTVRLLDVEGGCWQLAADDGEHYELGTTSQGLPADHVMVVARERTDVGSFCMVGRIITVVRRVG